MRKTFMNFAAAAAVLLGAGIAGAQSQNPADQLADQLKQDHAMVLATIEKIQSGQGDRKQGLTQLQRQLVPHMRGEEQALYPALQQASGADAAKKALQEHQEAEKVFKQLMKNPEDPKSAQQLTQLQQMLQAHIKSEEGQVLPMAKQKIDSARMQKVMTEFQAVKKKTMQSL